MIQSSLSSCSGSNPLWPLSQIPLGAGIAFAEQYRKSDFLCACYMGDGAIRQGALHEAFNMAMLWKLPVLYIIENNNYAMGTSVARTSNVTQLYTIGEGYDMPAEPVDGMSVEDVHLAMERAAKHVRSGKGPYLLEMNTYRYKGHSMSDPARYRSKKEVEEFKSQDPVDKVLTTITDKKIATKKEIESIQIRVQDAVEESVRYAEESPYPEQTDLYQDVYAQKDYPFIMD